MVSGSTASLPRAEGPISTIHLGPGWLRRLMTVTVLAALVMTSIPVGISPNGLSVPFFDWFGMAAGILGLAMVILRMRTLRTTLVGYGSVAIMASAGLTALVHPSSGTTIRFIQLVGMVTVAFWASRQVMQQRCGRLVQSVGACLIFQCVVAVIQIVTNGPVGVWWFGETEGGFRPIAGVMAASGTLIHPNALGVIGGTMTAALIVAVCNADRLNLSKLDRLFGIVGSLAGACAVTLTLTRSAQIALVFVIGTLVVHRDRKQYARFAVALMVVVTASMAVRSDAWIERSRTTVAVSVERAGSGRLDLNRQAVAIGELEPVFGVGLGEYFTSIQRNPSIKAMSAEFVPVHNVFLHTFAVQGVIGVVALMLAGLALIIGCRRCYWAMVLLIGMGPGLMLDCANFVGAGPGWTALTIGLAVGLARSGPSRVGVQRTATTDVGPSPA
jgi:hypothetical protein